MHGDVFRAPKNPNLLSVLVGSGVQLLAMVIITLCACTLSLLSSRPLTACALRTGFAVLGFLSPANRGGLMTAMLLLFVFMGYAHRRVLVATFIFA